MGVAHHAATRESGDRKHSAGRACGPRRHSLKTVLIRFRLSDRESRWASIAVSSGRDNCSRVHHLRPLMRETGDLGCSDHQNRHSRAWTPATGTGVETRPSLTLSKSHVRQTTTRPAQSRRPRSAPGVRPNFSYGTHCPCRHGRHRAGECGGDTGA